MCSLQGYFRPDALGDVWKEFSAHVGPKAKVGPYGRTLAAFAVGGERQARAVIWRRRRAREEAIGQDSAASGGRGVVH